MKYITILFALILSGCNNTKTFITSERCQSEDWKTLGYQSALAGKNIRVFDKVKEVCGQQQAAQAQPIFVDGYSNGLIEYCTFDTGFAIGEKGLPPESICPLEMRKEFLAGHRQAKIIRDNTLAKMEREKRLRESMPNSKDRPKNNGGQ